MEMKKVLKYAMEIGECMLVSGAGVSRVEDTISRICKAYGAKEANVFSITSSIVTTIEDEKGEILTQTKRIRSYKTDFTKLDELNQLSRYMCKELPEEEEVKRKIAEIKKGKFVVFTEEVLTSAVIAAAWTSFYGGGITEGIIAMIAGAFVAVLARYIKILAPNEMVLNFLLSFFVAAFAYISAKFGLTEDYGKIIIGNIMLLVPGVAFVNALRDMIGGDMMSGILRVCESILLAVFLAAGSFMALMFLGGVLSMTAEIIQVLASFVGSFGFAVLYNLRGKKLCMAGISGMVSWIAYLIVWNEMPSTFVANLAAAAVATIYAETMARILKTPVTVFLITGIIPLVPGGNLYYTMNYVLAKQWHLFYLYGQKTLLIAVAVAAGIMTASSVYGICASVWKYCKKEI